MAHGKFKPRKKFDKREREGSRDDRLVKQQLRRKYDREWTNQDLREAR